jgi:transcriptional regulator with XRE-family HTH domain
MTAHDAIMHNASQSAIPHLHSRMHYAWHMPDAAERLRIARLRAGFTTGKEAAEAMGFPVSTYLAHENGSRGYPASKAATYARKFKVPEVWLLYGTGPAPGTDSTDETAEVIDIVKHLPPLRRAEAIRILRVLAGENGS